ncbi:MAG TPA: sigma-E processing peptidase SpoIIGA [Bacillaceae bacterium]|nr:sigma-E processing peptidase SpoIIGA [Paenibacillus bovis]HLU21984.1 sigma-E processing peptidase SpoIIGA [Bacillaceae bacterium]
MVVYLDIIWLLNLLVDSLLLWTTSIFLKRKIHPVRIFLGGLLGSIIILLAITPIANVATNPFVKIGLSILMVYIAFGFKRLTSFLSSLLTFYFATFLMGGILLGTHYFLTFNLDLQSAVVLESVRGFGDPVSWLFLLAAFPLAWHFSKRRIDGITVSNIQYDVLMDVSIDINGLKLELKGLIDSGNQLYDPISKTPVMIISVNTIKDMIPNAILTLADEENDVYASISELPPEWSNIMRIIPAKSIGRSNQLLCAFKPQHLSVGKENEAREERKALIVFSNQQLSSDGRFQCIIHPKMAIESINQSA